MEKTLWTQKLFTSKWWKGVTLYYLNKTTTTGYCIDLTSLGSKNWNITLNWM